MTGSAARTGGGTRTTGVVSAKVMKGETVPNPEDGPVHVTTGPHQSAGAENVHQATGRQSGRTTGVPAQTRGAELAMNRTLGPATAAESAASRAAEPTMRRVEVIVETR